MEPDEPFRSLFGPDDEDDEIPTEPEEHAIRAFWEAFAADEVPLAEAGITVDNATAIHERLGAVSGALVPEIGEADASGRLMLAIGADGIAEYAAWAEQVVAAAPVLSRWAVRAFRPPKPLTPGLPCEPCPLPPEVARFHLEPSAEAPGKLDLVLCLPDAVPPPLRSHFGFQLLDAAIGERGVMTCLDAIDFGTADEVASWGFSPHALRPLTELPGAVRAHGLDVEPARGA